MARDIYSKQHSALTACCASLSCCELICGEPKSLSFLCAPSRKFKDPQKMEGIVATNDPLLLIYQLDRLL
jgi:hypothetical protein